MLHHVYTGDYPDTAEKCDERAHKITKTLEKIEKVLATTTSAVPVQCSSTAKADDSSNRKNHINGDTKASSTTDQKPLKRKRSSEGLSAGILLEQDTKVYLCAKALQIQKVTDPCRTRVFAAVQHLLDNPDGVTQLVKPIKRLLEGTKVQNTQDRVRNDVLEALLLRHHVCDTDKDLKDLLLAQEPALWSIGVSVLKQAKRKWLADPFENSARNTSSYGFGFADDSNTAAPVVSGSSCFKFGKGGGFGATPPLATSLFGRSGPMSTEGRVFSSPHKPPLSTGVRTTTVGANGTARTSIFDKFSGLGGLSLNDGGTKAPNPSKSAFPAFDRKPYPALFVLADTEELLREFIPEPYKSKIKYITRSGCKRPNSWKVSFENIEDASGALRSANEEVAGRGRNKDGLKLPRFSAFKDKSEH